MNKFFRIFFVISIYFFVFSTISYAGFDDIKGHWCEEEINSFCENGFVDGYLDGTFRPNNEISRSEFCKIINSYMGYEISGEWQTANMELAKEKGYLTSGKADDKISREEAFVVLSRVMKLENVEIELPFVDSSEISVWALSAIKSLTFMEYINGYEDMNLRPKANITRAEVIKILYAFVGIGGVDEEIGELEFTIGYLQPNKYGIEFIEIEDVFEIQSGDVYTLAAIVPNDEEVVFEMVSGEGVLEFDKENLMIEGIACGKATITAEIPDNKKSIIIKVK